MDTRTLYLAVLAVLAGTLAVVTLHAWRLGNEGRGVSAAVHVIF